MFNHSSSYAELTDEQFIMIGKIVVEFSNIEVLQSMILSKLLLSPNFLGRAYTENINASQIQNMLKNACDIHERRYHYKIVPKSVIDSLKQINSRITKAREYRNKFAHYLWSRSHDQEIFGIKLEGRQYNPKNPNSGTITITLDNLRDIYKEAYLIVDELQALSLQIPELEEDKELVKLLKFRT